VCNRLLPAEEFFWLTNAYVGPAIVIVLGYEEGLVLDSRPISAAVRMSRE
jgi:hypothetical protein